MAADEGEEAACHQGVNCLRALALGGCRCALGNKCGAACATGPRHDCVILGGGFCDRLDEACVGFHGSYPQSAFLFQAVALD